MLKNFCEKQSLQNTLTKDINYKFKNFKTFDSVFWQQNKWQFWKAPWN
jgi:hypothetical protein